MSFEVTATRKRPQNFESLAGQEFVVSTLKNSISQGRIAHAYLFSGPRGVGKTSSARLLAKALNCIHGPTATPCGECDNCRGITAGNSMDVIEIDGASNTGVNDVRAIKEEVLFPPSSSRYKIYIIDEVHMLSQSAFNALLKTIEEPPEYVVFIFATTELQKVPATVRSRCQQFNFQLIPIETIKGLLQDAVAEMGIQADEDALFWIAKEATGSMRDAYTLFDQVVSFSDGHITMESIREKLGLAGTDVLNSIMQDILASDREGAMEKLRSLIAGGVSIEHIIKDFSDYFRDLLLIREGVKNRNVLGVQISAFPQEILNAYTEEQLEAALDMFLNLYRNVRYSINPRFELELALSRLFRLKYTYSNVAVVQQLAKLKNDLINGTITPVEGPEVAIPEAPKPAPVQNNTEQQAPEQNNTEQQPETESVTEPVSEPTPEPEPEPVPEPEPEPIQEEKHWTEADLAAVVPQGVGNINMTENGLVLEFGSRLYYSAALQNRESVVARIHRVTGDNVNVVLNFSEKLDEERRRRAREEEQRRSEEEKLNSQKEDLFEDLMYAFDGKEVR